jgi:tetratricopeptide (TPR) repeat protein
VRDCQEAARRWRALRGGDSYEETAAVNQLGMLAHTGGHYDEALAQFRRYEQLNLRWHSPTHPNLDIARVNAADTLVKLGRAAEAEPIVRDLITRRDWGSAYDVLGQVLRERDDVAGAIAAFRHQATAGATHGYGDDQCHGLVAVAELELARRDRVAAAAGLAAATPVCTQHAIADAAPRIARLRAALAPVPADR